MYIQQQLNFLKNTYTQPIKFKFLDEHTIEINQGTQRKNYRLFKIIRCMLSIGLQVDYLIEGDSYSYIKIIFAQEGKTPNLIVKHLK